MVNVLEKGDTFDIFCNGLSSNLPTTLLQSIAQACVQIQALIQLGALSENVLGSAHSDNVQGEVQQNLDILSNNIMLEACRNDPTLAAMCSEESEDFYPTATEDTGKFLLMFDPLDGSSNIDVNVSIGTIFSILPRKQIGDKILPSDFYQPGENQLVAGYAIYGPQTTMVITVGNGVHMFTLDVARKTFICTHPSIVLSPTTKEFAINMSNMRHWEPPVQAYVNDCLSGSQGPRGKDFNMRWIASMVAEVHRILCRGGVFMYPWDVRMAGRMSGRLRLLYEANPMSFLMEQAGGAASTGVKRMLSVIPHELHQRVPVILGCKDEVETITGYYARHAATQTTRP